MLALRCKDARQRIICCRCVSCHPSWELKVHRAHERIGVHQVAQAERKKGHRAGEWIDVHQVAQAGSKKERRGAQRVLQEAAEAAVGHVPAPASAALWLQLFPAFQALALPCSPLANLLLTHLMTLAKGPSQVPTLLPSWLTSSLPTLQRSLCFICILKLIQTWT